MPALQDLPERGDRPPFRVIEKELIGPVGAQGLFDEPPGEEDTEGLDHLVRIDLDGVRMGVVEDEVGRVREFVPRLIGGPGRPAGRHGLDG